MGLATAHYEKPPCQTDEKQVQVQGLSGDMCSPACTTGSCPTDVVSGVTASPTCALQDTSGNKYALSFAQLTVIATPLAVPAARAFRARAFVHTPCQLRLRTLSASS